jgi:thiamine monophosphate synthase
MFPKFYPIVPDSGWIARIVPLGVKAVQLRIKDAEVDEIEHMAVSSSSMIIGSRRSISARIMSISARKTSLRPT